MRDSGGGDVGQLRLRQIDGVVELVLATADDGLSIAEFGDGSRQCGNGGRSASGIGDVELAATGGLRCCSDGALAKEIVVVPS